jgi:hypothetical protein
MLNINEIQMKKQYLENFLKNHLEDEFQLSLSIIDFNGKTKNIKSTELNGRKILDLLNFGVNAFNETSKAMVDEAILSELPEEEHMNYLKQDDSPSM